MKKANKIFYLILFLLTAALIVSCNKEEKKYSGLSDEYVKTLLQERAEKDSLMRYDEYSPFNRDKKAIWAPLSYYEPTAEFIFKSKFYPYEKVDTVLVAGTRGEMRKVLKEGYVKLNYKGKEYKLNVYKGFSNKGEPYYSIWLTDRTTGKETYGVGRYLEFDLNPDTNYVYTLDFNRAYNPYCAYSAEYTCPIPREEDYIDFAIRAGEKTFHP